MSSTKPQSPFYIGIDVGTGSARVALVDASGCLVAESSKAIQTFRNPRNYSHLEQSTTDIWQSICVSIKKILDHTKIDPSDIKGIGLDATCSLAVIDNQDRPVNISENNFGPGEQNVILWADHRAKKETELINITNSKVLNYVGGHMSPEMELPKILWLKNHLPKEIFDSSMFFDLPDFLSYYLTGSLQRSNCSLVCKCGYVPHLGGWDIDLLEKIGLESLTENDFSQLGGGKKCNVLSAGQPVGQGLCEKAAKDCGLLKGTPVGSGVIDAYAGWIGTIAATTSNSHENVSIEESQKRLAVIAGTSTCHIVQSKENIFVPGIWGPYNSVIFNGYWCNEGGQSSTGQLIDFIIDTHPAKKDLDQIAKAKKVNIFEYLAIHLEEMRKERNCSSLSHLTRDIFIYPDISGNRSPIADPNLKGMIIGMTLDKSIDDLAMKYYACMESIALQTRQIVDMLNDKGHDIKAIYISGGHAQNNLFMHLLSIACKMPVYLPHNTSASVVLGSAILGAVAHHHSMVENSSNKLLWDMMVSMTKSASVIEFKEISKVEISLIDIKYEIFLDMLQAQQKWRSMITQINILQ